MYKIGAMSLREETYTLYELESSGFYRLDICQKDARFNLEPDKVLFSIYTVKNKSYIYGDRKLYNEYKGIKRKSLDARGDETSVPKWEKGKLHIVTKKECKEAYTELIKIMGKMYQETYAYEKDSIYLTVLDNSVVTIEPANKKYYESLNLETEASGDDVPYIPLSIIRTRINLEHLKDKDMKTVKDVVEFREYLRQIKDTARECRAMRQKMIDELGESEEDRLPLIVVDFETTGLDMDLFGKDKVVNVIVSTRDDESRLFPFNHEKFENLPWECFDELCRTLKSVEDCLIAYNKKFEHKVFYKYGYKVYIKHDPMQLSILKDPRMKRNIHSLKHEINRITGNQFIEFEDIFPNKKLMNFAVVPEDLAVAYACPDGFNARDVFRDLWRSLPSVQRFIYGVECEVADVKSENEYWGLKIDEEKFLKSKENCEWTINYLRELVYSYVKKNDWKLSSNDVLSDLLYNKFNCPVTVKTKKHKPSTGAAALTKLSTFMKDEGEALGTITHDITDKEGEKIIDQKKFNKAKYPVVQLLIAFRKYEKLRTAFYEKINNTSKAFYDEVVGATSRCRRFFFWINQNGAESGRQSSPAHQFPKAVKACVRADTEQHVIVNQDYCQIELRVLPSLAKETSLIAMCKDKMIDIHRAIGSIISKKRICDISADERQEGKRRNFGVVYLISAMGLAAQIFGASPSKQEVARCKGLIEEFFMTFKRISMYLKKNEMDVLETGAMWTYFHRARYFPDIFNPDITSAKRSSLIRQANNLPVQGTAADIMKISEVRMYKWIKEKGWDELIDTPEGKYPLVRLMLSAHDEALVSKHESVPMEEVLEMMKVCMEIEIKDFAPLFANPAIIDNWKEGKSSKFEMDGELRDRVIDNYKKTGKSVFSSNARNNKDEAVKMIKEFRDESLIGYMEDLIAEVGLGIDELMLKVNHPSYTHELIDNYSQTDEDYKKDGKLTHEESIRYAINKYIESRDGKVLAFKRKEEEEERDIEKDMTESLEDITRMAVPIFDMDDDGRGITEEDEEDDVEDFFMYDDDYTTIEYISKTTTPVVYQMFNDIIIDPVGMLAEDKNKLAELIYSYVDPSGFYGIYIINNEGKMVDTGLRTENFDFDKVEDFIVKHSEYLSKERGIA